MLRQGFAQLFAAVFFAAFSQEIDDLAAGFDNPIDAAGMVDKAQHFDTAFEAFFFGPLIDVRNGFFFADRNPRRCYFDSVDAEKLQQCFGNIDLFRRRKGNSVRLLTIP